VRRSSTLLLVGLLIAVLMGVALSREDDGMLAWLERRLIYYPSHEIAYPLAAFGAGAEEVRFGERGRLHGIFLPSDLSTSGSPAAARTVVFFHGNGGNLSHRAPLMARMRTVLGANVFIFDYQGYGQSGGRPSEAATAADARAAIDYLTGRGDIDPRRIAYYGESLGGAVAIDLARDFPPAGLVVQSAFTSLGEMTRLHYPALGFLLPFASMRYDALASIRSVQTPLLVIHGGADTLVPADHGRHLFEAANEPKRLVIVPDADHNDVIVKAGASFWEALREHPGFGAESR
jgi:uncharacterized protein